MAEILDIDISKRTFNCALLLKSKMLIIGAAMRKLVHIIFGVLKSGQSFTQLRIQHADNEDGIWPCPAI